MSSAKSSLVELVLMHGAVCGSNNQNNVMTIEFCGAAQTVTGSQHLLTVNGKKILLDCGLFQGRREEANAINKSFLFDPKSIDAVILSHAHIDHSGKLPALVKQGFEGKIYSTSATRDLCSIMLTDSAMIQEKDANYLLTHKGIVVDPLYTQQDVAVTMEQFRTVGYHKEFTVVPGVRATFYDAGHILGSAITMLTLTENEKTVRLCFTGDVGRPSRPILRDPEFPGNADYIISESTYGGRLHNETEELEDALLRVIDEVVAKKGKLIIPSFSVGRTQDILFHLNNLFNQREIKLPVFVDSPLAFNATHVYRMHPECYDEEIREVLLHDDDPFGFGGMKFTRSVDESRKINSMKKACVIIAASGMCESGRVLHHLMNSVGNSRNTILFVGYMAPYTLGHKLQSGDKYVNIMGDQFRVKCEKESISGLSAHADENELVSFLESFDKSKLKQVFLVHGEKEAQTKLMTRLQNQGFGTVSNPSKGTVVELL